MQLLKMRTTTSIIGNLTDFLIQNGEKLKQMFDGWEVQHKVEKLADGREVQSLMFTQQNLTARFMPTRIDYTFSYKTPDSPSSEGHESSKQFFKRIGQAFPQIVGQRIAVVWQGFIKNPNDEAIHYWNDRFGLTAAFGASNEIHFKINNPTQSFETLNSVLNVDMGEAKNNKTNEVMKVLLVSIDVNTLAKNTENRFDASKLDKEFDALFYYADKKAEAVNKF